MIEWIPHDSSECPVKPGSLVEADYGAVQLTTTADSVDWGSVRRYRVRMPEGYATADDRQEAGTHYRDMPVQPWAVMASCMPDGFPGFLRGNVLKYAMRAGAKGPALDDARKCAHYAQKWVETLETQSGHERTQAGHA